MMLMARDKLKLLSMAAALGAQSHRPAVVF